CAPGSTLGTGPDFCLGFLSTGAALLAATAADPEAAGEGFTTFELFSLTTGDALSLTTGFEFLVSGCDETADSFTAVLSADLDSEILSGDISFDVACPGSSFVEILPASFTSPGEVVVNVCSI